MSRIYIGGGGAALFVGATVGLLMGKGSVLLAVVGLVAFIWGITTFWTKYSAARNALLAKHTWDQLQGGDARGQVGARVREISGVSTLEMMATCTPAQTYGFYALAMASLGLPPALPGERWFSVSNPHRAAIGADPELASAKHYFRKKYGVDINLDD
jgi:hypothetical protein